MFNLTAFWQHLLHRFLHISTNVHSHTHTQTVKMITKALFCSFTIFETSLEIRQQSLFFPHWYATETHCWRGINNNISTYKIDQNAMQLQACWVFRKEHNNSGKCRISLSEVELDEAGWQTKNKWQPFIIKYLLKCTEHHRLMSAI